MNKYSLVFLSNQLISLIADYGYGILLNIIIAQVSVQFLMFFWLVNALTAVVALKINANITIKNTKFLLIFLQILKGILLIIVIFFKTNYFVLFLVFLIGLTNVVFGSQLYSLTPQIISKEKLLRFNSLYTSVGSISYFIAPLFVGLLVNTNQDLLFVIYAVLLFGGAMILLFLPDEVNEMKAHKREEKIGFFESFNIIFKNKFIFNMLLTSLITGVLGTVFDAYEVRFIVNDLKISQQDYSFSLSFLAIIFLVVSFLISFKKKINNYYLFYGIGLGFYVSYLLIFGNSKNFPMILISYACLAIGQTMMGISEGNYRQTHLEAHELSQIFTVDALLHRFSNGISVILFGMVPFLTNNIPRSNMFLSILASGFSLFLFGFLLVKNKVRH